MYSLLAKHFTAGEQIISINVNRGQIYFRTFFHNVVHYTLIKALHFYTSFMATYSIVPLGPISSFFRLVITAFLAED